MRSLRPHRPVRRSGTGVLVIVAGPALKVVIADAKSVDLKNDQEVQDFFKNRSNKTLVWLFN